MSLHFSFHLQSEYGTEESQTTEPIDEEDVNPFDFEYALIDMRRLARLFRFCPSCGSPVDPLTLSHSTIGSAKIVTWSCPSFGPKERWDSQSKVG